MGKPHPIALRERVVAFVNEGNTNREAARQRRPGFGPMPEMTDPSAAVARR